MRTRSLFLLAVLLFPVSGVIAIPPKADTIVVYKEKRLMRLYKGNKELKCYKIALGGSPTGHKQREGDRRTPEGFYQIEGKNPGSRFYKSLRISYPNVQDRKSAIRRGVKPGGDIMIHGLHKSYANLGKLHLLSDWTDGCIAVTNPEMDEIWQMVGVGTRIEIRP